MTEAAPQPHTSYIICATPRSGSYLLCEALAGTGVAGRPDEYFWSDNQSHWTNTWGVSAANYADFLARALAAGSTPNGVFGAKIMWGYFDDVLRKLRSIPRYGQHRQPPALLGAAFPNLHYIWIKRADKVRQAISLWKATQTQVWLLNSAAPPPEQAREPVFDFREIDRRVREMQAHERAWERFFAANRIEPFTVVYEALAEQYESTALAALRFLHVSDPPGPNFGGRMLKRQANAQSDAWVQRYHELKGARRWWWPR